MELISRLTAGLLLITLSPLLVCIGIANLLVQGRPIFFRQLRIGKNFKTFIIYKFRSIKNQASNQNAFSDGLNIQANKWGKFLRKTKLDELPQLVLSLIHI